MRSNVEESGQKTVLCLPVLLVIRSTKAHLNTGVNRAMVCCWKL